jgi:hypothetical protein
MRRHRGTWEGENKCQDTVVYYIAPAPQRQTVAIQELLIIKCQFETLKQFVVVLIFPVGRFPRKRTAQHSTTHPHWTLTPNTMNRIKSSDGCQQSIRACSSLRYQHSARSAIIHSTHTLHWAPLSHSLTIRLARINITFIIQDSDSKVCSNISTRNGTRKKKKRTRNALKSRLR